MTSQPRWYALSLYVAFGETHYHADQFLRLYALENIVFNITKFKSIHTKTSMVCYAAQAVDSF